MSKKFRHLLSKNESLEWKDETLEVTQGIPVQYVHDDVLNSEGPKAGESFVFEEAILPEDDPFVQPIINPFSKKA